MPSRDKRITAIPSVDPKEYHRQWKYIKEHPDCKFVPPDPRVEDGRRFYKERDPRITADIREDLREYNRQKKYVSMHPDCVSVPCRRKPYKKQKKSKLPTHLICVDATEDRVSYDRQYGWLRRNPEAKSIPQHIIDGPIYKKKRKKRDDRLGLLKSRFPVFITKANIMDGEIDGDDV